MQQRRSGAQRARPAVSRALPVLAPLTGLAVVLVVWVIGGRAGWGSGMIVTPDDALAPLFGDSSDVYARATRDDRLVGAARPADRGRSGIHVGAARRQRAPSAAEHHSIGGDRQRRPVGGGGAVPADRARPRPRPRRGGRDRRVLLRSSSRPRSGSSAAPVATHDVATALGTSRFRRLWSVQLPASWPSTADGLKLAAPAALAGAVFGEWYGAERGLGVLLITSMQGGRADRLWAAALLCAAAGLIAYGVASVLRGPRRPPVRRRSRPIVLRWFRRPGSAGAAAERSRARHAANESAAVLMVVVVLVGLWWTWVEVEEHRRRSSCPHHPPCSTTSTAAPGAYLSAALHTMLTAFIALDDRHGVRARRGAGRITVPVRRRDVRAVHGAAVGHTAVRPLPAVRPDHRLQRAHRLGPRPRCSCSSRCSCSPGRASTPPAEPMLDVVEALGGQRSERFRYVVMPAAAPAHRQRVPHRRRFGDHRRRRRREPDRPAGPRRRVRLLVPPARPAARVRRGDRRDRPVRRRLLPRRQRRTSRPQPLGLTLQTHPPVHQAPATTPPLTPHEKQGEEPPPCTHVEASSGRRGYSAD